MPRSPERSERHLGLRLAVAALVAVAFLALAVPDRPGATNDGALHVLLADGTLSHNNSRDGSAILTAANVWPGWTGEGEVTITNDGTAGSWLRLTTPELNDVPGPAGGKLSSRMTLIIEDATTPSFVVPVYVGTLADVGERWLGRLEPGEARLYRFRTRMESQAGDNLYQSAALNVRFDWAVSDTEPVPEPPVRPPATPPVDPPVQVVPDGDPVVIVNRGKLIVRLAVPAAQRPLTTGSLMAFTSCSRRCTATLGGRMGAVRRGSSGQRTSSVSRLLPAGIRTRVKLRIRPRTLVRIRRAIASGRSVRGRIQIVARDRSGRVARASQRIKLVPAPRR